MDLLETVLRCANAEDYIETLKSYNIDASTLPLLTDSDLSIMGVDNADVRKLILEKSSTLQIPHEKAINLEINKEYVELLVSQMSYQLHLHHAALTCAVAREDLVVCNVRLGKASKCLLNCLRSLDKELENFEKKFSPQKAVAKKTKIAAGVSSAVLIIAIGLIFKKFIF